MIKGVVYQNDRRTLRSRIADPIADDCIDELKRDVELFKELGLNTLFICMTSRKPMSRAILVVLTGF